MRDDETDRAVAKRDEPYLSALTYIVSHDLRSPLNTLGGLLQLLKEDHAEELSGEGGEILALLAGSVERLKGTVSGVEGVISALALSPELCAVNVQEVVQNVVAESRDEILKCGAQVEIGALPELQANGAALRRLFSNLLANTLRFTVAAPDRPSIEIGVDDNAPECTFYVRDNGPGMDAQNQERLQRLFSGNQRRGDVSGAGLGLAICRRCAELHGGRIWVDEQRRSGTQVNVFIPTKR